MKYLAPQRPNGGVFDVVSFGAKNDGSADATAAFQSAWNAANTYSSANVNSTLLIPPGEYLLQGRVTAKANVVVSAYGAYIAGGTNFTSGQGNIMINVTSGSGYTGGTDNVTIMGGIWDAKGQLATTDQTRNIFTVSNCKNWRFLDCTMRNVPTWHAIDANAVDGMEVRGCRFEGFVDKTSGGTRFFSEAIQLDTGTDGTPCKNVSVSDCYMGPAVDGTGFGGFGKLVGSHAPTVANTDFHSAIRVVNNTIIDAGDSGVAFYDTTEAVVANNLIKDAAVYGILFYGNISGVSQRISVTGNSIQGSGTRGIFFDGASGGEFRNCVISSNTCEPSPTSTQATIDVDRWIGGSIVGNTVYDGGSHGLFVNDSTDVLVEGNNIYDTGATGIQVDAGTRISVIGNKIKDVGHRGIWIANATTKSVFQDNTIIGAGSATNNTYGGIEVSAFNNNDNLIQGNRIQKAGAHATNFAIRPIHFASSNASTNVQIAGNSYDGFTEKGIMVAKQDGVGTSSTTGSWVDMSDGAGPTVQMVTGSAVRVTIKAVVQNTTLDSAVGAISFAVSGAHTRAADYDAQIDGIPQDQKLSVVATIMLEGITPGLNTFTMKYRLFGGQMSVDFRQIIVEPIVQ